MYRAAVSLVAGAAVLSIGIGSAPGADLPTKAPALAPTPVWSWAGSYVGLNAGYGWGSGKNTPSCVDNAGVPNGPFCQVVLSGKLDTDGFAGGGQIGHNWQFGRSVFGVEADFSGSSIRGSTTQPGPFPFVGGGLAVPAATYLASAELSWFGTARLRGGYAIADRTLLYVTAGAAYGEVKLTSNLLAPNAGTTYPGSTTTTKVGWTAGGGVEHAFTDRVIARFEGLYIDLGNGDAVGREQPFTFAPFGYTRSTRFDLQYGIVRAGVSYKFN